uniref:UPAR/Ly6 domain-containing protein n=1 Tax=Oryzias sinensis TaxID=183150 RepID=A0A8C7YXH5_9TELE
MHLFALTLGIWLLPKGDTLTCWECTQGISQNCTQRECPSQNHQCGASRVITYIGGSKLLDNNKLGCVLPEDCGEGSINFGLSKIWAKTQCCNYKLCNNQWVPDPIKTITNGRQCFGSLGLTCSNVLACEGNEDHCITTTVDVGGTTTTVQGCASKLMCSASNIVPSQLLGTNSSCCKGNLCNSPVTATAVTASAGLQLVVVALVSLTLFS